MTRRIALRAFVFLLAVSIASLAIGRFAGSEWGWGLFVTAVVACLIPAVRATRVDPMLVMRD